MRLCKKKLETIDHIVTAEEYTYRHNNIAKQLHHRLAQMYILHSPKQQYYTYTPQNVVLIEQIKLLWNWSIQTDKPIQNTVPDVVLVHKQKKETVIIPLAQNIEKKHR